MNPRRSRRRMRRGISVPEMLTAGFSFALMLSGFVLLTINSGTGWSFGSSKMTADNSASLALQAWAKDIRNGRTAYTSNGGAALTVVFPTVNAQGDYDRNDVSATTTYTYTMKSGKLVRTAGTYSDLQANPNLPTTQLGKKITAALFSVSGPQVTLSITARQQNGTKAGVSTLSTQVYLRNEPPQ